MNLQDPALTFALAVAGGLMAQVIARHVRLPGIIFLLATGVLLGPEFANLVRPGTLGDGLNHIVGLAVAVILFEGALQLNLGRVRRQAATIRNLITIGAATTIGGAAAVAMIALGWDIRIALLFGTLVSVTGPTVINPLTRRIRLTRNLRTILEAEGVLIDPIGAILAVVVFEVALASSAGEIGTGVLGLPARMGLGFLVGIGGGFALGGLLKLRRAIPSDLRNVFTLAGVLALYQGSHAILPESGIMTVAVAGLVVGNIGPLRGRELIEFSEQLTHLLVGLLFVLLAAAVDLADVRALGYGGIATVLALVLVIRPLSIALCTRGTKLRLNEKAFLAWLAPRGIVAFAVTSLFAAELAHGGQEAAGDELRAMVFLVIAATVIAQGGTAGLAARALRVRKATNDGFALVGANPVGRALARTLLLAARPRRFPIVVVDTNPAEASAAEAEASAAETDDLRVVLGNANDERTLVKAGIDSRRAIVALTPNEGVNRLISNRVEELYPNVARMVAVDASAADADIERIEESGASLLFGHGIDYERWAHEFRQDRVQIEALSYEKRASRRISELDALGGRHMLLIALVHQRGKQVQPVSSDTELKRGDAVWFGWPRDREDLAVAAAEAAGFRSPGSAEEEE